MILVKDLMHSLSEKLVTENGIIYLGGNSSRRVIPLAGQAFLYQSKPPPSKLHCYSIQVFVMRCLQI